MKRMVGRLFQSLRYTMILLCVDVTSQPSERLAVTAGTGAAAVSAGGIGLSCVVCDANEADVECFSRCDIRIYF